jgi:hypothetical protein
MKIDQLREAMTAAGCRPGNIDVLETLWLACAIAGPEPERTSLPVPAVDAEPALTARPPRPMPQRVKPEPLPPAGPAQPQLQPPSSAPAAVYPQVPGPPARRGSAEVVVPEARALHRRLAFQRALRPLKRTVASRRIDTMDEQATAEQIAQLRRGQLIPVLRPSSERWLDAAVVFDTGDSMRMWRALSGEVGDALTECGVFRSVRRWEMCASGSGAVLIRLAGQHEPRSPNALLESAGRQVIIVVSDCSDALWHSGAAGRVVDAWAQRGTVVITQPLPERLWHRTGAPTVAGMLSATIPCPPNSRLSFTPFTRPGRPPRSRPVPVIQLDPNWINRWACVIADGTAQPAAVSFPGDQSAAGPSRLPAGDMSPVARVMQFRSVATPQAFQLAGYLAVTTPALPVMRLVHETMLPHPRPSQLAEVILSGLLRPVDAGTGTYEFLAGVADVLLDTLTVSDLHRVRLAVSRLIESRVGLASRAFRALIDAGSGSHPLIAGSQSFALVSPEAQERMMAQRVGTSPIVADASGDLFEATVAAVTSAAQLTLANSFTVRFRDRSSILADLAHWCSSPDEPPITIVTGAAGEGKSRLAAEVIAERQAAGWYAGFLSRTVSDDNLETALAPRAMPVLIVVDQAETRPDQIETLLLAALTGYGRTQLKILLVARSRGQWWNNLRRLPGLTGTLDRTAANALEPLEPTGPGRAAAFEQALIDYAGALRAIEPQVDWSALVVQAVRPDFDDASLGCVAVLHSEALRALCDTAGAHGAAVRGSVQAAQVRYERRYIELAAVAAEISFNTPAVLDDCLATVALLGANNVAEARNAVQIVFDLDERDFELIRQLASWLHDLYPGHGNDYWGPVGPRAVAEHVIVESRAEIVAALLPKASAAQTRRALTFLANLGASEAQVRAVVLRTLAENPRIAGVAAEVATTLTAGAAGTLFDGAAAVLHRPDATIEELQFVADKITKMSRIFEHDDADAIGAVIANFRRLARASPRYRQYLGLGLRYLARALSHSRRDLDALAAIVEANEIYRVLAARQPQFHDALVRTLRSSVPLYRLAGRLTEAATIEAEIDELASGAGDPAPA